jgi:hypothetical protein
VLAMLKQFAVVAKLSNIGIGTLKYFSSRIAIT